MWTIVLVSAAAAGVASAAVWFLRAKRIAEADPLPSVDSLVRSRRLSPGESAMLAALCARAGKGETPPWASTEAFDRCAAARVRDVLARGGDARADADQLRGLRKTLAFADPAGESLALLSEVILVAPTGNRSDGIVIGRGEDRAAVAARGAMSGLRPGVHLTLLQPGSTLKEDIGAPVLSVDDRGDFRVVHLDLRRGSDPQRRTNFRLDTHLPAEARIGEGPDSSLEPATVVNVSRAGARLQLRVTRGAVANDPVDLRVHAADGTIEAKGRVAWARKASMRGWAESVWVLGVEFPAMTADDWARIVAATLAQSAVGGAGIEAGAARTEAPQ